MITLQVRELKTITEKAVGLLTAKKAYPVLFRTRFGIHTFGMKFAIDVLVLDSKNVVVVLKKQLNPNRIFIWNPRFDTVIELPEGEIEKLKIQKGSAIKIIY